jgi:hypothetical protein
MRSLLKQLDVAIKIDHSYLQAHAKLQLRAFLSNFWADVRLSAQGRQPSLCRSKWPGWRASVDRQSFESSLVANTNAKWRMRRGGARSGANQGQDPSKRGFVDNEEFA